jgi:hypothetical protein
VDGWRLVGFIISWVFSTAHIETSLFLFSTGKAFGPNSFALTGYLIPIRLALVWVNNAIILVTSFHEKGGRM